MVQSSLCGPRNLAIMSIVCGLSCVGVKALILALQAEHETDQEKSVSLSRRSRRMSALSILLWLGVLLCVPFLLVLLSYVLAVAE
ncbi:transmembrane protein 265 [Rhinophrynus dorsalis]